MQNQAAFVMYYRVMCVVACVILNVFHPGELFGMSKERGVGTRPRLTRMWRQR
jgi:hypothetical protein